MRGLRRVKVNNPLIDYIQIEYWTSNYGFYRMKKRGSTHIYDSSIEITGRYPGYLKTSDIGDRVEFLTNTSGWIIACKWKDDKDYFAEVSLSIRRYGNDLYFEPERLTDVSVALIEYLPKLKFTGYNDSYWWNKVAPVNNTKTIDGIKFVCDFKQGKMRIYQGDIDTSDRV